MDVLSQALVGAIASQAFFSKKLGKATAVVGALSGMAPDLDVFINSSNNPALFWEFHRGFTHSLLFIPFGGLILGLFCLLIMPKLRSQYGWVILAAIVGYGTHGLLDACTSYGTQLYWPFSNARVEWNIISIVDPVFTGILLVFVWYAYRDVSEKIARWGLCWMFAYLMFGVIQHHRAVEMQYEIASLRHQEIIHGQVVPGLGSLLHFHSVYQSQNKLYLDRITTPLFSKSNYTSGITLKYFSLANLPQVKANKLAIEDIKKFYWFSNGFLVISQKDPLVLADARFIRIRDEGMFSLWGIKIPAEDSDKHVRWIRNIKLDNK